MNVSWIPGTIIVGLVLFSHVYEAISTHSVMRGSSLARSEESMSHRRISKSNSPFGGGCAGGGFCRFLH